VFHTSGIFYHVKLARLFPRETFFLFYAHMILTVIIMNCSITDLRNKEVINGKNGCRLGTVCDVEIDTCSGCVASIIIWGKGRFFGLLPSDNDIKIPWKDIEVIGNDTIIVCCDTACNNCTSSRRHNILETLFK